MDQKQLCGCIVLVKVNLCGPKQLCESIVPLKVNSCVVQQLVCGCIVLLEVNSCGSKQFCGCIVPLKVNSMGVQSEQRLVANQYKCIDYLSFVFLTNHIAWKLFFQRLFFRKILM